MLKQIMNMGLGAPREEPSVKRNAGGGSVRGSVSEPNRREDEDDEKNVEYGDEDGENGVNTDEEQDNDGQNAENDDGGDGSDED